MQAVTITQITPNELTSIIEETIKRVLSTQPKPQADITTTGSRLVDAKGLAKYLKRPISAVYQMQHKKQITAKRIPGSRRLYYNLDEVDNILFNADN